MTGHEMILAMRHEGKKPTHVMVSDFADCTLAEYIDDVMTVRVHGDTPELLDLRFLIGTTAMVESDDPDRLVRIADACKPFAERVVASLIARHDQWHFEVTKITDTKGLMTWPT
jgi:hypothetical protein